MRLLIFGEDPRVTRGGIARYVLPLAAALADRGYEVDYLFSGALTKRYDWTFRRRWRTSRRENFTIHELLNAKGIGLPSVDPGADITGGDIAPIRRRVESLEPDVIHIHSLVGIPMGVLPDLSRLAPVIVSVHDYFLLCQRRVLVQRDDSRCRTFATQSDCAWCVDQSNPRLHKLGVRFRALPGDIGTHAVHAGKAVIPGQGEPAGAAVEREAFGEAQAEPFRDRLAEAVRLVNESASSVIAVSEGVREILLQVGFDERLVEVMHIGSASAETLRRLPLPSRSGQPVTFMFLGSLGPVKGARIFVEALQRVEAPLRVVIAGGGPPDHVREIHADAPEHVQFRPAFTPEQLPELLAEADVVVAPAVAPDAGPQVVLEALAAGRPVIGSDVGGIPDFVQDGVNGRIFPCEDVDALASVLSELNSPSEVARLAKNARLRVTVDQHVEELAALYESHLRGHIASVGSA